MARRITPYARAVTFFYTHAGWGYRRRGARQLAKAEAWAESQELVAVWQDDPDCGPDDFELEADKDHVREHGAVACVLYRPCAEHGTQCRHAEVLGSLWAITESLVNAERDAYRRVVEAELALGAMLQEGQARA